MQTCEASYECNSVWTTQVDQIEIAKSDTINIRIMLK